MYYLIANTSFSITKTNRLILFRQIIVLYFENHMKRTLTSPLVLQTESGLDHWKYASSLVPVSQPLILQGLYILFYAI